MLFQPLAILLVIAASVSGRLTKHRHLNHAHNLRTIFDTTQIVNSTNATGGCGTSSWTFSDTGHKNVTMGDRSFLVHIPADYHQNVAHPLVLSFHGFKKNDVNQEEISGFSQKGLTINGKGLIAVYPMGQFGPGKTGNESIRAFQGAPYSPPGVDDIAFTQQMIKELQNNLCVDSKRIYASGKSNGGGFTNLLACTPSTASIFAAFAPVSAALYSSANPQNCTPGRSVPIINFHGLNDSVIPFNGRSADEHGNTAYATPNITEYRDAWALRNGCGSLNKTAVDTTTTSGLTVKLGVNAVVTHPHIHTTLRLSDCSATTDHAVVNGFTVDDLGHSWPSTAGLDGGVTTFNATTANIIPFFDEHSLM